MSDLLRAIADALHAVNYVGTAGDVILEIEGVLFRCDVRDASVGAVGVERIAAVHRFQTRKVAALSAVALLSAGAVQQEWQPIATAPRDCIEVLLGWFAFPGMAGSDMQRVGFWHDREHAWCDTHQVLHNQQSPPTHWMPLPDPPAKDAGAA